MKTIDEILSDTRFNLHLISPFMSSLKYPNAHHIVFIYRHIMQMIFHVKYCGCEKPCEPEINIKHLKNETKWTEQMIIESIKWLQNRTKSFDIIN